MAFNFCKENGFKAEFRKLCELLRNHLANFQKYSQQPHSISLDDNDSFQKQLSLRFSQLNNATELELWHESFRSVDDIYNLLSASKITPKVAIMADYYDRIGKTLLVSENYLWHAAAINKFFKVSSQNHKLSTEIQAK